MSSTQVLPLPLLSPEVLCAHCGLPVPGAIASDQEQFCCNGCRQVHAILHQHGLQDFYRLRQAEGAVGQPAKVRGRAFQDFDDALFAERYVRETGRGTRELELYVEGVHCAACAWLLERLPSELPGLLSLRLDLPRSRVKIELDPSLLTLSALAQALDRLGYTPHPWHEADLGLLGRAGDRALLLRLGVAAAGAMNIMFLQVALYAGERGGMEHNIEALFRWSSLIVALPVMLYSSKPFVATAWQGIRRGVPHIDLPIALAMWAGFLASVWATLRGHGAVWYDSVTMLVALLLGGRYLQARAWRKAIEVAERQQGASKLDFARRIEVDGETREIPIEALRPDDRIEVRSGELFPADGRILAGSSRVDEAALTGESKPRSISLNDSVHAHTLNLGAAVRVSVRAVGFETRVGALLARMEEAHRRRAPLATTTDRIGRVFVVVVLVLALLMGGWWAFTIPDQALERIIALLVVACPCALGLATPLTMTSALSQAARQGISIQGADVVQTLSRVRELYLDKTGTLTEGSVRLERWSGSRELLRLASALGRHSIHPIARALQEPCEAVAVDVQELPGRGMLGRVEGREILMGSMRFLESRGVAFSTSERDQLAELARAGLTPLCVAADGRLEALGGLGDPLRPEAPGVIEALRGQGWRVRILSGDHPDVVRNIASKLGIPEEDALGGLSPEDKLQRIQQAVERAHLLSQAVMMVGDGVNDAAAMAAADVGVAVSGGSGASVRAASVVLTRPGLQALLLLRAGSKRVLNTIWRNLGFSLVFNLVGISLALFGVIGPLLAAILMPLSSLTVTISSIASRSFTPAGRGGARWT